LTMIGDPSVITIVCSYWTDKLTSVVLNLKIL
jgi:hypothetical protein